MTPRIEIANPDDYASIAEVLNAAAPPGEAPVSGDELRAWDTAISVRFRRRRYVARDAAGVLGIARRSIPFDCYDPRTFWVGVDVHPHAQGRGVGSALYDRLVTDLRFERPTCLMSDCREDQTASIRFLRRRGFEEAARGWISTLDLATFDPDVFADRAVRFREQSLEVRTLDSLRSDADWRRNLYDLAMSVERDQPLLQPFAPPPSEEWHRLLDEGPGQLPDATFVALDGDRYVAMSGLELQQADPVELFTSFTGVRREYRGRGIAWGLKLRGIEFAIDHGFERIRVFNSSRNLPMLSINERLGFAKQPASIEFVLRPDAADLG